MDDCISSDLYVYNLEKRVVLSTEETLHRFQTVYVSEPCLLICPPSLTHLREEIIPINSKDVFFTEINFNPFMVSLTTKPKNLHTQLK